MRYVTNAQWAYWTSASHRLKPEFRVDGQCRNVVRLYVEHHVPHTPDVPEIQQTRDGERLAQSAALRPRVHADDVHLAHGLTADVRVHLGPVEARARCRPRPRRAAGRRRRTTTRASAARTSSALSAPCSGCQAKAGRFTSTTASSSWPGRKARNRTPSGRCTSGRSGGRPMRSLRISRARRNANRRASAAAAGWSPCAHTRSVSPGAASGAMPTWSSNAPTSPAPTPCRRAEGRTTSSATSRPKASPPVSRCAQPTSSLAVVGEQHVTAAELAGQAAVVRHRRSAVHSGHVGQQREQGPAVGPSDQENSVTNRR